MIQRQQTLWLLLATVAAILSFMFPFVTGKELVKGTVLTDKIVDAGSDFFLLLLTGATSILSAVTIFLFKDRKLQIKLCLLGVLITIVLIVCYVIQMNKLTQSTLALFCILPFIILASYFLAFRNIRKDEKLVKSLEKLR